LIGQLTILGRRTGRALPCLVGQISLRDGIEILLFCKAVLLLFGTEYDVVQFCKVSLHTGLT
jgi:hypothetical protein